MRKLKNLANALKANDFVMTEEIKKEFEEYLSIIADGSRVLHPRFGLGTTVGTQGETFVGVRFDREYDEWLKEKKERVNGYHYMRREPVKYVHITSCTSVDLLVQNEMKKKINPFNTEINHKNITFD